MHGETTKKKKQVIIYIHLLVYLETFHSILNADAICSRKKVHMQMCTLKLTSVGSCILQLFGWDRRSQEIAYLEPT
jgi:hypothetical protein